MSYASLMVHVGIEESSDARIRLAASLAHRFDASLIGISACGIRPSLALKTSAEAREDERDRRNIEAQLEAGRKNFRKLAKTTTSSLYWRSAIDFPNDFVTREARAADLLIIDKDAASHDSYRSLDPGDVLLKTGRPVLAVPGAQNSLQAKNVLVAWKDTREARRALREALPFLREADAIFVTEVCDESTREDAKKGLSDVANYLLQHGIAAGHGIRLKGDATVADELIQYAQFEGADLIVSGAYGHSRLGEWIFGGVTRDLLAHSPVCCLYSY